MQAIRLHLGCGMDYRPGCVNVDSLDRTVADLCAAAQKLPLTNRCAESVEAYHLIEHLGYIGSIDALSEAYRVLRPGGSLLIETPDVAPSFAWFLDCDGRQQKAEALNWIFGHETEGMSHLFLFPPDALQELLERIGFEEIRRCPPRTHTYAPGYRVEAKRGNDPVAEAVCLLRGRAVVASVLAGLAQPVRLELERTLFETLAGCVRSCSEGDVGKARSALARALVTWPSAAAWFMDACEEVGLVVEPLNPGFARQVVRQGVVPGTLWRYFVSVARADGTCDAFDITVRAALQMLLQDPREALRQLAGLARSVAQVAGSDSRLMADGIPTPPVFTRAGAVAWVHMMWARAARHNNRGEHREASVLLRRLAEIGIDTQSADETILPCHQSAC